MSWLNALARCVAAVAIVRGVHGQITPISDEDMQKYVANTGDQRFLAQLNAPWVLTCRLGCRDADCAVCISWVNWAMALAPIHLGTYPYSLSYL